MKKKYLMILVTLILAFSLVACGGQETTEQPAEPVETETAEQNAETNEGERHTSSENKVVVLNGELEKLEGPIYLTSVGQSADVSMLDALLSRMDVDYTFNSTATAEDISGSKTVIIAAGASSKGLGAAGISADDESARAQAIMDLTETEDITVVLAHLGGASRRGELSDQFADQVLEHTDILLIVEDGNEDGKFTSFAENNGKVIALVNAIADSVEPLESMFK